MLREWSRVDLLYCTLERLFSPIPIELVPMPRCSSLIVAYFVLAREDTHVLCGSSPTALCSISVDCLSAMPRRHRLNCDACAFAKAKPVSVVVMVPLFPCGRLDHDAQDKLHDRKCFPCWHVPCSDAWPWCGWQSVLPVPSCKACCLIMTPDALRLQRGQDPSEAC